MPGRKSERRLHSKQRTIFPTLFQRGIEPGTVLFEDPEFEVKKGALIYEATTRVTMGCAMAYALSPIGNFTRKLDLPEFDQAEWIERRLG